MINRFALALLVMSASPVLATENTRTVSVKIADLNLRSPAGIAALDRRLALAARQVCAGLHGGDLNEQRLDANCRARALNAARANRDAVVALAQSTQVALLLKK